MGGPGFTEKRVRIEEKNQYTLNVESGSTRTEIKYWVERLFGVKVRGMNSHRLLLRKGQRMGPSMGHRMHYRRLIITLQPSYSIPPLRKESNSRRSESAKI